MRKYDGALETENHDGVHLSGRVVQHFVGHDDEADVRYAAVEGQCQTTARNPTHTTLPEDRLFGRRNTFGW